MTGVIRHRLGFALLDSDAPLQPVDAVWPLENPAQFAWHPRWPHEVVAVFGGKPWRLAWELLVDGLDQAAGIGDVFITPIGVVGGHDRHEIVLDTPYGRVAIQVRSDALREFVGDVALRWAEAPLSDEQIADFYTRQAAQ